MGGKSILIVKCVNSFRKNLKNLIFEKIINKKLRENALKIPTFEY